MKAVKTLFGIIITITSFTSQSKILYEKGILKSTDLIFEENKNQWTEKVLYKTDIRGGRLFLERNTFTYVLYSLSDLEKAHEALHAKQNHLIKGHVFKVEILGTDNSLAISAENKHKAYHNYFIGNDTSRWASEVGLFGKVNYKTLYQGIDLKAYSLNGNFKYDFLVSPLGNPADIRLKYTGADNLSLENGNLIIKTSVTNVVEHQPYAYQIINGEKISIECNFILNENTISFSLPQGYNKSYDLTIDPVVVASTYSGSTATTYGHAATYDNDGNIYTGGRCFGPGYPVTTGAFQTNFVGGGGWLAVDIAISKLDPTGSNLIYATYLGGNGEEYAQSMFVNSNDELYVYGSCSSEDYPVTLTCYDSTYNSPLGSGDFDIVITKINSTGTALLGSTYVGGSANDGYNDIYYNYADELRGEIIVDDNDNPYIASFTSSTDFPTTSGAYSQSLSGFQDACLFKMNSDLSVLSWSTYLGGSNNDAAYGLRLDSNGDVYIVGGTNTASLPTTAGVLYPTYQGGSHDGFITHLQNNGSLLSKLTYYGTSSFDEVFFIDLDTSNNVYIYGLTEGTITPTPGVYSNTGSGQFITKLNPDLSAIIYSTVFGSGSITPFSFSPSAFLIDVCENVYVSGWGTTTGFQTSPGAIQTTTDGQDFYLMVLAKDAASLTYATFYGAAGNFWFGEHVDGGTSRFDKRGIVYQAVCSCLDTFPTTANAYATVAQTGGSCDIAVFKIDFQSAGVYASAVSTPSDTGCAPFTVNFTNSSNGINCVWDFDDGSSSTATAPSHTFNDPGIYDVSLLAIDSNSCNIVDSVIIKLLVFSATSISAGPDTSLCIGDSINLSASGGTSYLWAPTNEISDSTIANPIANPSATTTYTVTITNICGSFNEDVTITVNPIATLDAGPDIVIVNGQSISLNVSGGYGNYNWTPSEGLSCSNCPNPSASPSSTTTYYVSADCALSDSVIVYVNEKELFIPNILTPNEDGFNNKFNLTALGYKYFHLSIYNRWGKKVFESSDPNNLWDGTILKTGKQAAEGVYYYILDLTEVNEVSSQESGFITLIR